MRIGLLIYGSLDTLTGGFLYDRMMVRHLREAGHDVRVFSLPWPGYAGQLAANRSHDLIRDIQAVKLDILLQDELCHPALFLRNRLIRGVVNGPVVSIVHHLRVSEEHARHLLPLYRAVERHYLATVDAFIYNGQTTRRTVERLIPQKRHVVAYPSGSRFDGLNDAAITARAAQQRPLEVVFLGGLIPRKGLHTLLDALRIMQSKVESLPNLTVVGNTEFDRGYTADVRQQIQRYQLGSRVTLTGQLPDEDVAARLAAADVLAVPSQYEGFGIAYLEGMAFGLPAIGTTGGAAGEIITHSVTGFLPAPGDAGALAGYLIQLASDRTRLKQMSIAARRRFETHPTWADSMGQVEAFLRDL